MRISDWVGLIGLVFGGLSLSGGFILWWRSAIKKSYAAERDFNHIRRNQEQLLANIKTIADDFEDDLNDLKAELKEIKAYIAFRRDRPE